MNRTRLLLIGFIALALGAFVSFGVYRNLQQKGSSGGAPGEDVVIAASDIPVGAKIGENDIKVVHLPAGDLPPHRYRLKSQVQGRGVVVPITRGEFVLAGKLAGENAGYGLPALIPPGMRAVSVRVNEVIGVAGFVQPGTRVDVLLTGNPTGSSDQQTTTALENVAVIANGQRLERTSAGESQVAPVITLLVSPDDAQKLALASTGGKIQLALRNPLDTKQQDLASLKSGALYRIPTPVAAAPAPKSKPKHTVTTVQPAAAAYEVEVIRGNKRDIDKF